MFRDSWKHVFEKNQKRYNLHLAGNVIFITQSESKRNSSMNLTAKDEYLIFLAVPCVSKIPIRMKMYVCEPNKRNITRKREIRRIG